MDELIRNIILLDDDDDDDFEEEEVAEDVSVVLVDAEGWRRMGDPTFKSHFRMDRCLFEALVVVVGRHMTTTNRVIRKGMSIDRGLMMTLLILATPDTFRSTGVKFGVPKARPKGSVHNQYKTFIEVLRELRSKFIQWPSAFEREIIAQEFEESYGYPGVIGCIDGTHIRMTAPFEQPLRYINRHQDYSIILQGVCDRRLLFRDVCLGQPGAVGDARTFQRSPLSLNMLRQPGLMGDKIVVGDGAYQLTSKLIVPYRDYGNLTHRQRTHNRFLSSCRASIERTFALLKGKWRRLKYFPNYCLDYAIDHIMACIVLHNFIILEGDEYEDANGDEAIFVPDNVTDEELLHQARIEGYMKREYTATMLCP